MAEVTSAMKMPGDSQKVGNASEEKLPLVPQDITTEWLSAKLGHDVESIIQTGAIWGTASKIFYALTYKDKSSQHNRPTHICVKGGFMPELTKELPPLINFYRVEAKFFNIVAPNLTYMRLPKCWWAGENAEQGIVIMDDLNVKGYDFGEPTQPWTVDRVKDGVEQLAALHAGTWGASRSDYPWVTKYEDTMIGMFEAVGYHDLVRDPERFALPDAYQDAPRVKALLTKYYASRNPRFRCLVHGDAHLGNACIAPGGVVDFIDWQILDSGSCFHDVSYFISAALTVEDRRNHEMEILDHYLERLAGFGGPKFSRSEEDVMVEYKKSFLTGMGWAVTTTGMQPHVRINALLERFMAALLDHEVLELVEGLAEPAGQ
jgi:hypothetical protein